MGFNIRPNVVTLTNAKNPIPLPSECRDGRPHKSDLRSEWPLNQEEHLLYMPPAHFPPRSVQPRVQAGGGGRPYASNSPDGAGGGRFIRQTRGLGSTAEFMGMDPRKLLQGEMRNPGERASNILMPPLSYRK